MRFLIFFMLAFNLHAASWSELEVGEVYTLGQSFQLRQIERSNASQDFTAGERFSLSDRVNLGHIKVSLFIFDYLNCPGSQMRTEMEIIAVKDTSPVVEVGAQLEKNCKLELFLENRDIRSRSIFE
jgi:hypothetical protein